MREGRLHLQTGRELEEDRKHDSADSDGHSYSDESPSSRTSTGDPRHISRTPSPAPRDRGMLGERSG